MVGSLDHTAIPTNSTRMKIHGTITINGVKYHEGDEIAWYSVYPFFMVHMLMFGASGFFMAYSGHLEDDDGQKTVFLFMHGGLAITVYLGFYVVIFGLDSVKWMFINAGLGLFGIYAQIGWILAIFGKQASDFPIYVHVIPFLYYMLYTFLLHQMVLDVTGAREDEVRRKMVDSFYVVGSVMVYVLIYLFL